MSIDEMKDRIARAEEIQRYTENRCEALEKENAELKHAIAELRREKDILNTHTKAQEKLAKYRGEQLTKAKELLKDITSSYGSTEVSEAQLFLKIKKAEQFLKDSEVEK